MRVQKNQVRGFSLMEMLIVVTIIGILSALVFPAIMGSLAKGRDSKRKQDLIAMRTAFEDYSTDKDHYPPLADVVCGSTALQPYLKQVPCDPQSGDSYLYLPLPNDTTPTRYRLLTALEKNNDPDIVAAGCSPTAGCGGTGVGAEYTFGIAMGMAVAQ